MTQTICITGSTDGIGFAAARQIAPLGHTLIIHGRDQDKLETAKERIFHAGAHTVHGYVADLTVLNQVQRLHRCIVEDFSRVDVLINNAGVLRVASPINAQGYDKRFVVNTIAPYLLTMGLLPVIPTAGRIINIASAAQHQVDFQALTGGKRVDDFAAYAQSKLALMMWSHYLASQPAFDQRVVLSLNPGSLLATKMVRDGFGVPGKDIDIGANIIVRAALSDEFAQATGRYYDNDTQAFAHPSELDDSQNTRQLIEYINQIAAQ